MLNDIIKYIASKTLVSEQALEQALVEDLLECDSIPTEHDVSIMLRDVDDEVGFEVFDKFPRTYDLITSNQKPVPLWKKIHLNMVN